MKPEEILKLAKKTDLAEKLRLLVISHKNKCKGSANCIISTYQFFELYKFLGGDKELVKEFL